MTRLTLDLPDDLQSKLKARAAETGHGTVEQYVEALLRSEAAAADEADDDDSIPAPEHLTIRSAADLAAKLREGLDSGPATEMTPAEWASIKSEVAEKLATRQRTGQ